MSQTLTGTQKLDAEKKFLAFGLNASGVNQAIKGMEEDGYSAEQVMNMFKVFGVKDEYLERGLRA